METPIQAKKKRPRIDRTNVRISAVGAILRAVERISPWFGERLSLATFRKPRQTVLPLSGPAGEPELRWFDVGGIQCAIYIWHSETLDYRTRRKPVLLVHGWGDSGLRLRNFVPELLALGHDVIAFDAIGHGRSGGRQSDVGQIARTIAVLNKHYGGFDRVIAHSAGSAATMIAAARRELPIEHAVLLSTPASAAERVREFVRCFGLSERTSIFMLDYLFRHIGAPADEEGWLGYIQGVKARTKVYHDPEDRILPYREAEALRDRLPNVELHPVKGLGHFRLLNDRAVIEGAVAHVHADAQHAPHTASQSAEVHPPVRPHEPRNASNDHCGKAIPLAS